MSTTVNQSINELPLVQEVVIGDKFIIDNGEQTRRVDFVDFIIGLENVTFAQTILDTSTNVASISSQIFNAVPTAKALSVATHYIKLSINGSNYALMLSATS